jgi:MIF4G domain
LQIKVANKLAQKEEKIRRLNKILQMEKQEGDRQMSRGGGGGPPEEERWIKSPGPFSPARDMHVVMGQFNNAPPSSANLRPGEGANYGVLKYPQGQPPNQFIGGVVSPPVPQGGGLHRSGSDLYRWQHVSSGMQCGLIPSPIANPHQVVHKAVWKYEVGKLSDKEEAKQQQLKAIINKLTPQNFDKLFEQVVEVNIDNPVTLAMVVYLIFDKALMEPTRCEMYANFCSHLSHVLPDFNEDNENINFKKLLLNKCQEEFERGEHEEAEADKTEEEGVVKQTQEEREERRIKARRRMLGNIRLIGELYKKKMLNERIMHHCIKKLLVQSQSPDEKDIEAVCELMSTIGEMIDHPKAKEHMDVYFDIMAKLSTNQRYSSRVRSVLKDAIDLRKNKWQKQRKYSYRQTKHSIRNPPVWRRNYAEMNNWIKLSNIKSNQYTNSDEDLAATSSQPSEASQENPFVNSQMSPPQFFPQLGVFKLLPPTSGNFQDQMGYLMHQMHHLTTRFQKEVSAQHDFVARRDREFTRIHENFQRMATNFQRIDDFNHELKTNWINVHGQWITPSDTFGEEFDMSNQGDNDEKMHDGKNVQKEGLGRGMSVRGQSAISNASSAMGDRMVSEPTNGFGSSTSSEYVYGLREGGTGMHLASPEERPRPPIGWSQRGLDRNFSAGNRPVPPVGSQQTGLVASSPGSTNDVSLSDNVIKEKSVSSIREFYRCFFLYYLSSDI